MDFSKYKKVKEDSRSTTMQSDGGHTITLMHSTLPRIQVEQLKRLKMGDGGRVGVHIPAPKKMADGGDPGDSSDSSASTDDADHTTNITVNAAPAQQQAPQAATQPPPNPNALPQTAAQYAAAPVQFQNPEIKPTEPNIAPNGTMDPGAVMRNTQTTAQNQQAIDTTGAKANAVAQSQLIQALAQNEATRVNIANELRQHTDEFAQYLKQNPVDADRYVNNMSGGRKIGTSLALVLGGMGQGKVGGDNPAATWLNNQVNRDMEAQKQNRAGQANILGAYQHLYGDNLAAVNATKASLMDLYAQHANQIALQLGTPQAAVNAQKFAATAAIEKSKALYDAAVNLNWLPGQGGAARGAPQPAPQGIAPHGMAAPQPGGHPIPPGATPAQAGQAMAPALAAQTAKENYDSTHILAPDAQNKLNVLAWRARHDPAAAAQLPIAQQQYQSAVQAEKALQEIDKIYPLAAQNTTVAGSFADAIEGTTEGLPFGMNKLGNLPGEAIRDLGFQKEKLHKAYSTQLEGYIDAALAGTGATPTDKGKMAQEYKPLESDSPAVQKAKLEGLKRKIIALQKTSALGASGMLKK